MALAQCTNHGYPSGKGANQYTQTPHFPVGYPSSGLICGRADCQNPGTVFLTQIEETAYDRGERVFPLTGGHGGAKFRVQ